MAVPVSAIICREITMSALREWAAASGGGAHKVLLKPWLHSDTRAAVLYTPSRLVAADVPPRLMWWSPARSRGGAAVW
jgi:phosphatidylglycerophosphate synthase